MDNTNQQTPNLDNPNIDFRTAYCRVNQCPPAKFEKRLLAQTFFMHARIIDLFSRLIHPNGFHAERALVSQAGDKIALNDIQLDIDFYQHKNVVGSLFRDSFKCRISGKRLLKIAKTTFEEIKCQADNPSFHQNPIASSSNELYPSN